MLEPLLITKELAGQTLAAVLRARMPGKSWSQVREFIASRRVHINDELSLDDARRVKEGEIVVCLTKPHPRTRATTTDGLVIRHLDEHLVVVEKPSGINTVRHPAELEWSEKRRELDPTLEDLTQFAIAQQLDRPARSLPRLRVVSRLDKETSGLIVFARSIIGERGLGKQFADHTTIRRYLALIEGYLPPQRIESELIRDRGDGRRGSTRTKGSGQIAITHIDIAERLPKYTMLWCRLETGRTHQIRIHLSEAGHPICGERVYNRWMNDVVHTDHSGVTRLALHAAELGFQHPGTLETMMWKMPFPPELERIVEDLRNANQE